MRANYRLQMASLPDDLAGLWDDSRRIATLCNWLWACDTLDAYKDPGALAEAMQNDEVGPAMKALLDAWRVANPVADDTAQDEGKKKAS
jgi:hypothetical protein